MSKITPFVNFKPYRTSNINNTPQVVFGSQYTCLLDSILCTNLIDQVILITLYVLTVATDGTTETLIANQVAMQPNQLIELIKDSVLTMSSGELLYAFTDYSTNLMNINISYRELLELEGN